MNERERNVIEAAKRWRDAYVSDVSTGNALWVGECLALRKAIDALAAPGLRYGCRVVPVSGGKLSCIVSACGQYALRGGMEIPAEWVSRKDDPEAGGWYSEELIDTALASAPPPPGVEPTAGSEGTEAIPDEWPTSAETSAVAWPISVMDGAEWNILDATGTRIAICGFDYNTKNDSFRRDSARIARAIVGMIENLKTKADTYKREYDLLAADNARAEAKRASVGPSLIAGLTDLNERLASGTVGELPSTTYRTVTSPAEIRAVLDRLPVGAKVSGHTNVYDGVSGTVGEWGRLPHRAIHDPNHDGIKFRDLLTSLTYRLSDDPQATPAAAAGETPMPMEDALRVALTGHPCPPTKNQPPIGIDEIAKANKDIPLAQRVNELDVWASSMSESCGSLASRVAEVERQVIHESRCRVELEGGVESIHLRFTDDIAALRRDVEAMRGTGPCACKSTTPSAPATPASDALPFGCVAHQCGDGNWLIRSGDYWWGAGSRKWLKEERDFKNGGSSNRDGAVQTFHATNKGVPPPSEAKGSERYDVVPTSDHAEVWIKGTARVVTRVPFIGNGGKDGACLIAAGFCRTLEARNAH